MTFALNNMAEGDCSDGDGAPEDVSLSRGREDALKARRVAAMESKRCRVPYDKEALVCMSARFYRAAVTLKERRRKREKLFTAQKVKQLLTCFNRTLTCATPSGC